MTFVNILADIYRRCGFAAAPSSDVATRIKAFVNETQQELLHEPGMEFLQNDSTTFGSVANQASYGLAPTVARIKALREATNRIMLLPMSLGEYRERYPDPTTITGTPVRWVDLGFDALDIEPADASTLYMLSSSASDTGTAYIEGVRSGGYPFTASIVMTGITAVAFVAPTDILNITKLYLSTAAIGTVTLREDSGTGTTLATIPIGSVYSRYRRIALAPTPAAAITYTLDYERNVTDLVNDTDEPLLPYQFHHMLAIGGRVKEYEKTQDVRYGIARGEMDKAIRKLKFWLYEQAVGTPNLRGTRVTRPSIMDGGSIPTTGGTSAPLAVTSGGTGFSSYAVGDLLYADTAASLAKLPDVATGKVLKSGGVGVAPAYGQVALATDVSGTLPVANGGTGATTLASGGVLIGAGTGAISTDTDLTFAGDTLSATKVASSSLTSGRVPIASTAGLLVDDADLTFATDTLTATKLVATQVLTSGVSVLTDGSTPALDASLGNTFTLAAAGDRTIAVPTNAVSGQKIVIRHLASGGARTLALNTGAGGFRFGSDITSLTQTASGKIDYIGCIYNGTDSKWDVVAVTKGF